MTRYTNFGRKRTYLQAGFGVSEPNAPVASSSTSPPFVETKKKAKRQSTRAQDSHSDSEEPTVVRNDDQIGEQKDHIGVVAAAWRQRGKDSDVARRAQGSEKRRLKRLSERHANTVCFACREMGHAAKDCTNTSVAILEGEDSQAPALPGRNAVGICYRCGSTKHTLSRCRKPTNPNNTLPFASCFVCSRKGHLASACPKNTANGVYPHGGNCKLCGETTHLARNCPLRKEENIVKSSAAVMGSGSLARTAIGADEDDFHIFKRRETQVEKDEKEEESLKQAAVIKAGALTGIIKSFSVKPNPSTKKVVFF